VSPPASLLSRKSMKSMKLTSRMVTSVSTTAVHRPRGPTRSSKCEGCGGERGGGEAEGGGVTAGRQMCRGSVSNRATN
jgi:hypothetical protein